MLLWTVCGTWCLSTSVHNIAMNNMCYMMHEHKCSKRCYEQSIVHDAWVQMFRTLLSLHELREVEQHGWKHEFENYKGWKDLRKENAYSLGNNNVKHKTKMFRSSKQTYVVNGWMWTKVHLLKTLTCSGGTEIKYMLANTYLRYKQMVQNSQYGPIFVCLYEVTGEKMSVLW